MLHHLHVAATAASLILQLATGAGEMKKISGPIMSVTESQVLVQRGTESVTVLVTKDTKITLDGKDAKVGDLKMNDSAEVSAEENSDRTLTATSIKAVRGEGKPKADRSTLR
jgi:hypothetical protein